MNLLSPDEPTTTDRELLSSRVFNWPREKVWNAWSDPARLARWWGPKGFTNTFHEFDLRPGGNWIFIMHGPDGKNYPNQSLFLEVLHPQRIVFDHVCPPHFRLTATFEDLGDKTRLTWRMVFESAELCQTLKPICIPANQQNFDRLEAELISHGSRTL